MRVLDLLIKNQLTISFAESITGGGLAYHLIKNPGASKVLKESYVLYSNQTKSKVLGINLNQIEEDGVVSSKTALQMAKKLKLKTNADICISSTGYACGEGKKEAFVAIIYQEDVSVYCLNLIDNNQLPMKTLKEKNIQLVIDFVFTKLEDILNKKV